MPITKNSQTASDRPVLIDGVVAAKMLSISPKFLSTLAAAGEVPSTKLRRRRLYSPAALEAWAAQRMDAGKDHRSTTPSY